MTAVNNDEQEAEMFIPVPFSDKTYVDLETGEEAAVENGKIHVSVKARKSVPGDPLRNRQGREMAVRRPDLRQRPEPGPGQE